MKRGKVYNRIRVIAIYHEGYKLKMKQESANQRFTGIGSFRKLIGMSAVEKKGWMK